MTRAMEPVHEADQAQFEQRLFESARRDAPPPGATERAWLQFAAAAGTLAPLVAATTPVPWFQGARARALKWTLIGAVGGGSLVGVWLRPAPMAVPPPVGVAASVEMVPRAAGGTPPAVAAPAEVRRTDVPSAARPRRARAAATTPAGAGRRASELAASLLAREVAALDAARGALAAGENASALRQIEQYHRDFPGGELSAEADVVAIEALAAAGDSTAARRAAQTFLERQPQDPHAARVRELVR